MSKTFKIIACILLAIVIAASILYSNTVASAEHQKSRIEYLENKEIDGKALITVAATTSVLMTLLPQDIGTPLAEKFADICGYFTIALCAILLEKYLLTLTGLIAFKYLIPAACVLLIIGIIGSWNRYKNIGIKVLLFAIAIYMLIPCSIKASQIIEHTYSIGTLDAIEEYEDLQETETENSVVENNESSSNKSDYNFIQRITNSVKSFTKKVSVAVQELPETITKDVGKYLEEGERKLSLIIEGLAILIVTSCIIPLLVMILFIYLIKLISGIDIDQSFITNGAKSIGKGVNLSKND